MLKILAVLFLNQFFDVFHAAHNYIESWRKHSVCVLSRRMRGSSRWNKQRVKVGVVQCTL
ncbi:hypothetical protein CN527_28675 [Bacillus cereus]|nr:hypothetical protein CN527_28675 [Bacillus cereus]PEZ82618.1 hypothetical protein CN374_29800 [Bacillus cereus]PGN91386.1 hypothetical protein CN976_24240 [Bacillus cereus]